MKIDFLENELLILICMCLAVIRIYLEVIRFDFSKLPITAMLESEKQQRIHRVGLYLSVGHILLFAPQVLMS